MKKFTSLLVAAMGLLITSNVSFAQVTPTCVSTYASSWSGEDGMIQFGANAFSITVVGGTSLSDTDIQDASGPLTGYLNRISLLPITLIAGGVYPSSVTPGANGNYQEVQVWIDFNDNGTFETSEEVSPVSGYGSPSPEPMTFNITIPAAANPGTHLLRMRAVYENSDSGTSLSPHLDPCLTNYGGMAPYYMGGTVTDYTVNIMYSTGVLQLYSNCNLTVAPNPARSQLTITAVDNITSIRITSLTGQTLYTQQYNSPQIQVDVSALPAGVYFVKINGTEVRKLVKE